MGEPANTKRPFRDAMRSAIADRWQAVWLEMPRLADPADIEAVHDVRVASRRLRAAMDAGARCFPEKWYRRLRRDARSLTRELGAVRDRDVQLQALVAEREEAPADERAGIERLIARIERERAAARGEMIEFLRDLDERSVAAETARRFGQAAGGVAAAGPVEAPGGG
ncbi:MAG TPA: CHAD domain-containing protein [Thermomicrobiales bacterium]|nr:CHAD domain-containing protein [Thermomicrobiales bacterium]